MPVHAQSLLGVPHFLLHPASERLHDMQLTTCEKNVDARPLARFLAVWGGMEFGLSRRAFSVGETRLPTQVSILFGEHGGQQR
jgi:hypothetical protein